MEIKATVIAYSCRKLSGKYIATVELEYPRFIHSELMTHRVFSRNAASSRVIPVEKMMKQVMDAPAMPVYWGLNQPGMQAKEEHPDISTCVYLWHKACGEAVKSASRLKALGLHKQIVNRILEPFQMMKTIVTSTEWDNFFELRLHKDAQPEFHELATKIKNSLNESLPNRLEEGEWHLPYVDWYRDATGQNFTDPKISYMTEALKVSASCCAQVSYRKNDDSLEKAIMIYDRLIGGKPCHASPFKHQAQASGEIEGWSGNFHGWTQHRKALTL